MTTTKNRLSPAKVQAYADTNGIKPVSKAERALALLSPDSPPEREITSISLRLPGDLAHRVFYLADMGLDLTPAEHCKAVEDSLDRPRVIKSSRNSVLVALIEAGLEAVESIAKTQKETK